MKKLIMTFIKSIIPSDYVILKKGEIIGSKEFIDEAIHKSKPGSRITDFGLMGCDSSGSSVWQDIRHLEWHAESIGANIDVNVEKLQKEFKINLFDGCKIKVSGESMEVNYFPSSGFVVPYGCENSNENAIGYSLEDAVLIASGLPEMQE